MISFNKKIVLTFIFLLISTVNFAQNNLQDLVGEKATYLDQSMKNKGFNFVKTEKSGDSAYQNWFNPNTKKCVTVRVYNGRIESIVDSPYDCGNQNDSNTNKTNGNLQSLVGEKATYLDQSMREKGYNFIKTEKSGDSAYQNWYNPNTKKCVTVRVYNGRIESIVNSPYDCGNQENSTNNNYSKYNYSYLKRQDAVYAYDELSKNGYSEQKTFQQDGYTYKVWFNSNTRDCLKTTSYERRISSIEVSTHCK